MNTFQKSLLAASALGLSSTVVVTPPASAGNDVQAYASGAGSIVLMNGASSSIGAEIAAPPGAAFAGNNANGLVTATINGGTAVNTSLNTALLTSMNVQPGPASIAPSNTVSVEAAVANIINGLGILPANTSDGVSMVRAWTSGLQ